MLPKNALKELQKLYSEIIINEDGVTGSLDITPAFKLNIIATKKPQEWSVEIAGTTGSVKINDSGIPMNIKEDISDLTTEWRGIIHKKDHVETQEQDDSEYYSNVDNESYIEQAIKETPEDDNEALQKEKIEVMEDMKEEKAKLIREENEKKLEEAEKKLQKLNSPAQNLPAKTKPVSPQILKSIATQFKYTETQVQAIKNSIAKGASDSEFEMLMYLANRYQLDPILKEIFYSSNLQTIMTSRDGYLKIAHRDPKFKGIQSMAVCENDDFEFDAVNCKITHKFGKGDRGEVIGAWAIVKKEGFDPIVAYAPYKEHVQQGSKAWRYKSAMCCKCAEAFALKRMFCITGLVTHEEFGIDNIDAIDAEYFVVPTEAEVV